MSGLTFDWWNMCVSSHKSAVSFENTPVQVWTICCYLLCWGRTSSPSIDQPIDRNIISHYSDNRRLISILFPSRYSDLYLVPAPQLWVLVVFLRLWATVNRTSSAFGQNKTREDDVRTSPRALRNWQNWLPIIFSLNRLFVFRKQWKKSSLSHHLRRLLQSWVSSFQHIKMCLFKPLRSMIND